MEKIRQIALQNKHGPTLAKSGLRQHSIQCNAPLWQKTTTP